ncbi:MAG: hypothetical protein IKD43_04915 [Clostridia bacterium]|nr:hypothetical protein [Clostridia bacterium]
MKTEIPELKFDNDFLVDSAQKRFTEGDYFGALTVLNKRESMHEPLADAYEVYADIYEAMELWPLAADAWFRFLDTCAREEFSEGYEGLAIAFMNMGNELQSAYYYHLAFFDGDPMPVESATKAPALRLVHDESGQIESPETIAEGLALLKTGDLTAARNTFAEIPEESKDFASGAGLAAMCSLMQGDEEGAEAECERLIGSHPNNVQILTTYCAVLGAREKREEARAVARKLYALPLSATDDLYRVATALCETGLHEEAYEKLGALRERIPYDENVLWFLAAAAKHTNRLAEAIEALETLTTLYPRKAVAKWYLERMRTEREGGECVPMGYFYRLPEAQYRKIASFLLQMSTAEEEGQEELANSSVFAECFRLAFDEMEGHDEKLQLLAAKVAVKCRADSLLRAALLDSEGDEIVKLSILHDLVCRNEENSFGTVLLNLYKEVFLHELEIGRRKCGAFMQAFADVYSKYALLGEDCEGKICAAGEDIYNALAEAEAWDYFDERAALSAAIYREARLRGGERSLSEICKLFDASERVTQKILDYMM